MEIDETTFNSEGRVAVGSRDEYPDGMSKVISRFGDKYGSFIAHEITLRHVEEGDGCYFEFEIEGELLER